MKSVHYAVGDRPYQKFIKCGMDVFPHLDFPIHRAIHTEQVKMELEDNS